MLRRTKRPWTIKTVATYRGRWQSLDVLRYKAHSGAVQICSLRDTRPGRKNRCLRVKRVSLYLYGGSVNLCDICFQRSKVYATWDDGHRKRACQWATGEGGQLIRGMVAHLIEDPTTPVEPLLDALRDTWEALADIIDRLTGLKA